MGSALRYLLVGLLLTGLWLLVALQAVPGGMADVEEFALFGWTALLLLFGVPIALIWLALWLIGLQRRVNRLQHSVYDDGGSARAPSYPLQRVREPSLEPAVERSAAGPRDAELRDVGPRDIGRSDAGPGSGSPSDGWASGAWPLGEAQEPAKPRPASRAGQPRAPKRVALSDLSPLSSEEAAPDPAAAAEGRRASERREAAGREAQSRAAEPPRLVGAVARPRRADLPEPEAGSPDTEVEPLPGDLQPHRPPRAAPDAPRLEALSPSYPSPGAATAKPLPPDQFAQLEARVERELNAIAMDLASVVSAPGEYDRALDAMNAGSRDAFFRLLAADLQTADRASLKHQLAMIGGESMLESYLEKYEQLLVAAYRSDPGGQSVKRLVDSTMGQLHQAIESYRQEASRS